MHAEDLVIDKRGNRHAVENVLKFFPDADGVATLALVVEAVNSVNLAAFVISAEEEEVLLVFNFVS